jgi:hypothetical protein
VLGEVGKRKEVREGGTFISDQPQKYSLWPGLSDGWKSHVGNTEIRARAMCSLSSVRVGLPGKQKPLSVRNNSLFQRRSVDSPTETSAMNDSFCDRYTNQRNISYYLINLLIDSML